jgi:hypothetical protein
MWRLGLVRVNGSCAHNAVQERHQGELKLCGHVRALARVGGRKWAP